MNKKIQDAERLQKIAVKMRMSLIFCEKIRSQSHLTRRRLIWHGIDCGNRLGNLENWIISAVKRSQLSGPYIILISVQVDRLLRYI